MSSFRDVLPALMDAYFIVDEQRRMLEHNRSFVELSGGRVPVREGMPVHCHEMVRLDICQKDCIALRAIRAGKAVQVNDIQGKGLDGRALVLIGRAVPLKDDGGNITSVLVTYRDITEETHLMERFHKLEKDTKQEKEILLKNLTEKTQEAEKLRRQLENAGRGGTSGRGGEG